MSKISLIAISIVMSFLLSACTQVSIDEKDTAKQTPAQDQQDQMQDAVAPDKASVENDNANQTEASKTTEQNSAVKTQTPQKDTQDKPEQKTQVIVISGTNFAFSPSNLTIDGGRETQIVFKNTGGTHDLVIEGTGLATKQISGGESDTITFTPESGKTYTFYCSVGSHRSMGMEGTITAK